MPAEEAHRRNMGPREGMQMRGHWRNLQIDLMFKLRRGAPMDPAHKISPWEARNMNVGFRQRKQAMGAFLTPNPP
jgi:hypothetical protein